MYSSSDKAAPILSHHLALLQRVSRECFEILDAESLAGKIVHLLALHLDIERTSIALMEQNQLCFVASHIGVLEEFGSVLPLTLVIDEQSICGFAAYHQQTVLVEDIRQDPRFYSLRSFVDTVAELAVPIPGNRRTVLGVITLQETNTTHSLAQIRPIIELVASELGMALENMALYRQMQRRNRYAQLLDTIRQQADHQFDAQGLLQTIVVALKATLPVRNVAIYLVEYSQLTLHAASEGERFSHHRPLPTLPITLHVAAPVSRYAVDIAAFHRQTLDIALIAGSATLGVMTLQPAIPLDEGELQMLTELGQSLGSLIERTRLFASMYATNERTTMFARIVSVVRRSLNIYDVIDEVNATLARALHVDWCSLLINDGDLDRWLGTASNPNHLTAYDTIEELLQKEIVHALSIHRSGIIDDLAQTTQVSDERKTPLLLAGVRGLVWTPLQIEDRWFGALCVYTINRPHRWSLDELRLLSDVADQLVLAYRQMQLYEAEQQRRRELETLQDIIGAIGGELSLVALCQNVVARVVNVFNISAAAVVTWKEPNAAMHAIASIGLSPEFVNSLTLTPAEVQRWIAHFPPPGDLSIDQLSGFPLCDSELVTNERLTSLYAQPLMVDSTFSGWLQMYRRGRSRQFNAAERRLAAAIAKQIAQAMDTARRYEEEHLLRTDAEQSFNNLRAVLEELEQTRERLLRSEKLRSLGELASGVAHDFNNLLTSILGNVQMVLLEEPPGERKEALRTIEQAAQDGAVTVRRIQDYARSSETVYEEVVDLQKVVEVGLEFARPSWRDQAQQRGITIVIETKLQPAYVLGSAAELREVFVNLLVNAVDALPKGGTITVKTIATETEVGFSVADDGPGVPPENRTRIFDPFFTTKPIGQGTGMGLAVALSIVQRHRGTLQIRSREPKGAIFLAMFPQHKQAMPLQRTPTPAPNTTRRILVVDDDPAVRQVVVRLLQRDRHEVGAAASAEQALTMLNEEPYDIIISDLGMPGMNGWQLLDTARQLYPAIRTALLTGWGYQLDADSAQRQHVDMILSKPFEMQTLKQAIAELAGGPAITSEDA